MTDTETKVVSADDVIREWYREAVQIGQPDYLPSFFSDYARARGFALSPAFGTGLMRSWYMQAKADDPADIAQHFRDYAGSRGYSLVPVAVPEPAQ
jgi:hypothetical protein